jgi:hypothetical protein
MAKGVKIIYTPYFISSTNYLTIIFYLIPINTYIVGKVLKH